MRSARDRPQGDGYRQATGTDALIMKPASCSLMRAVLSRKEMHLKMTKLKEEFFKILPPTIYFFVALHLVMFIRVLMLEGTGLSPYSSASIAVTALVLGKAVLTRGHAAVDQSFS